MKIFLTNDDGIEAPGIWTAAQALADMGEVTIVAPATNYSGYGAALPPAQSFSYSPYQHGKHHPSTVAAYSLVGSPASCAHVGLSGVLGGGPFDLVVSGINQGPNLGHDVFYSGTVGAALTAHLLGIPAIAISLDVTSDRTAEWETASWALGEAVRLWQLNSEPTPMLFNINVPNLPISQLAGTLITSPAKDSCLTKYSFARSTHVEGAITAIRHQGHSSESEPWTDAWAVALGHVAVTPLRAFPDLLCVMPWSLPPVPAGIPVTLPFASELTR